METPDSTFSGSCHQPSEKYAAQPLVLICIQNCNRWLGYFQIITKTNKTGYAYPFARIVQCANGKMIHSVNLGQIAQVCIGQLQLGGKEAVKTGLW